MKYIAAFAILVGCMMTVFFGVLKIEEISTRNNCKESIFMQRVITMEERAFCNKLASARTFGFKAPFTSHGKNYVWNREEEIYEEVK